jgi:hypothetical protein
MHILLLGISCLGVQFVAKYTGMAKKMVYDMVGLGGLFFLLTAASGLDYGLSEAVHQLIGLVGVISPIMGWLCLVAATAMGTLDVMLHPERLLPH